MDNIIYMIWLSGAVSAKTAQKLIGLYGSAENVYLRTDYSDGAVTVKAAEKLSNKNCDYAKNIYETCKKSGISILTCDSTGYPSRLLELADCPPVLYAKGIVPDWDRLSLAGVVGTRKLSTKGEDITERITEGIIQSGETVVSGFAYGADTIAAKTAVKNNSFTVAVLGCGVDVVYPSTNRSLYNEVLKNGVFISEYPPGTPARTYNFPQRNRIIAGLCHSVTVTESPRRGGSVITAEYALKYGREVFVSPTGMEFLMEQGAKAYTLPENVPELCDDDVLNALAGGDLTVDELCATLGSDIAYCNSRCFMLELEGKIRKLPGGFYHRL